MKLALVVPLVLASSIASSVSRAQAPGDYYGGGDYGGGGYYGAGPSMTPVSPELPPPPPPPRIRRFSVGLGIGHMSLAPHNAPDMNTDFGLGEIAIRYLLGRHLELELQLAGGDEQRDNNEPATQSVFEGVLGARWRFSPQARWNWWLMAGMGSLTVSPKDSTSDQRKALEQSTLQFGIGLERRWTRFAIQAELRAVGVKANDDTSVQSDIKPPPPEMGTTYPYAPETSGAVGRKGGMFGVTANYYF
jgi:hypothetical protein